MCSHLLSRVVFGKPPDSIMKTKITGLREMPTRTRIINEWGSDDTTWIDHYVFIVILEKVREVCYATKIDQMDIDPDTIRKIVSDLDKQFEESRKAVDALDDSQFKAWCDMLLRAV